MSVKRVTHSEENGQVEKLYCKNCRRELVTEFYNWSGKHSLLSIHDCEHYAWSFIGDPFLDPPQDKETKQIVDSAIAKVDGSGGKYFLLPTHPPILSRE